MLRAPFLLLKMQLVDAKAILPFFRLSPGRVGGCRQRDRRMPPGLDTKTRDIYW